MAAIIAAKTKEQTTLRGFGKVRVLDPDPAWIRIILEAGSVSALEGKAGSGSAIKSKLPKMEP